MTAGTPLRADVWKSTIPLFAQSASAYAQLAKVTGEAKVSLGAHLRALTMQAGATPEQAVIVLQHALDVHAWGDTQAASRESAARPPMPASTPSLAVTPPVMAPHTMAWPALLA